MSPHGPALFVHGNPETSAVWGPLLGELAGGDHTTGSEQSRRSVARLAGAEAVVLADVGHWWMVQDPRQGARTLTAFWSRLS
jgi:pimeloyl-ACP methyl ester carboxylesterase